MRKGFVITAVIILLVCILINCFSTYAMNNNTTLSIVILDSTLDTIGAMGIAYCLLEAKDFSPKK